MTAKELQAGFGIADVLRFEESSSGLVRIEIMNMLCAATLYLQGAHLTHWQPAGKRAVLFCAAESSFIPGKPIRGGVPLIFPWFSAFTGQQREKMTYPFHGFARTDVWKLKSANVRDDVVELTLELTPSEHARALGYDHFRLEYTVRLGTELHLQLKIHNSGSKPLRFEEAMHTYFAVSDIAQVAVQGLEGASYLDNAEGLIEKRQAESQLRFPRRTDSTYINTTAACVLQDEGWQRTIRVEKSGSRTTVIWTPGEKLGPALEELGPDDWRQFLCIETANARVDAVDLQPGAFHVMEAAITPDEQQFA